jgi:hypothetical protein
VLAACNAGTVPPATPASTTEPPTPTPRPTSRPTPTTDELLAALAVAAARTAEETTLTFEMAVDVRGGPGGRRRFVGDGQLAAGIPTRGWMHFDLTSQDAGTMDMLFDGLRAYLRADAFDRAIGEGKWILLDLASEDPRLAEYLELSSSSEDVGLSFRFLTGAGDDIRVVGREPIHDVPTTRYAFTVDMEAVLADSSAGERAGVESYIERMRARGLSTVFPAEGWVDAENLVRRVRYVWADQRGIETTVTMDLVAFGEPVQLDLPDEADTIPFEDLLPD